MLNLSNDISNLHFEVVLSAKDVWGAWGTVAAGKRKGIGMISPKKNNNSKYTYSLTLLRLGVLIKDKGWGRGVFGTPITLKRVRIFLTLK